MWAAGIQPWADSVRLLEMFICWFLAERVFDRLMMNNQKECLMNWVSQSEVR